MTELAVTSEVTAGDDVVVELAADGDGSVPLRVRDAFAVTTTEVEIESGRGSIRLPGHLTTLSGMLIVEAGGERATVTVRPAEVASVDVTVGPRTIPADGATTTMSIAVAADRFGNPVDDGTDVEFVTVDRTDLRVAGSARSADGVAAILLPSDTVPGSVEVFARATDAITSRASTYDEVAGEAATISWDEHAARSVLADGVGSALVTTAPLTDAYGNVVTDGRAVRLTIEGPDGVGTQTAVTLGGVARFEVPAPGRPGPMTLTVTSGGAVSGGWTVDALPLVTEVPVQLQPSGGDGGRVVVGPVQDTTGALVADGIPVIVRVDERETRVGTVAGQATFEVPDEGEVTVELFGVMVEVRP